MQQFLILFTSLSILFSSASAVPKDVAIAARDDIPFPIAPKDNPPSQPLEATCSQFNGSPSPSLAPMHTVSSASAMEVLAIWVWIHPALLFLPVSGLAIGSDRDHIDKAFLR
uniref:Uncharacterized protein n=1 Tax=Moniliophthora roreri TaxID=221103 RepID=A0A0W0FU88_MONRR